MLSLVFEKMGWIPSGGHLIISPSMSSMLLQALVRHAPSAEQAVAPRAAGPALRFHPRAHDAGV